MDIRAIAQKAAEFQIRLDSLKRKIAPTAFAWYPYDSLGNFSNMDEVLTGERRQLLELIGGERVLDIGCGDGDVAFFLESLGCRVDAVDNPSTNYNGMRGVWSLKAELNSGVNIHRADIDAQFELPAERYGAAFLLGVLYHLKNPFQALEILAHRARYCLLSTRIAAFTPDRSINFFDAPLAYLLAPGQVNYDATNYWIFSNASLRLLLSRTQWEILDYRVFGDPAASGPSDQQSDLRAMCCARSRIFDHVGAGRLLSGWHRLEENAWRWTERRFSVEFSNPPARGVLTLRLAVPNTIIEQLGSLTLSASVNGLALPQAIYSNSGEYVYQCDVTNTGAAKVEFDLDKALPPRPPDLRELGVMVLSVNILPS
ncbi:MAG TPA: class I SAM-dependent methyltransferase [Bryobacteraceae bacterium]|nr:class I SAM-dependent methyltransferase [Bryobacteraceae bacterium]